MSQNFALWPVYNNTATGARVNAAQITAIVQQSDGNSVATVAGGFDDVPLSNNFMGLWNPVVTGWLVFGNSSLIYFSNTAFTATFAAGGGDKVQVADITDAGATGKAVLKAADAATGRTALSAAASGANTDITSITGSAAKLTTARTITLTVGASAATPSFDGSANVTGTIVLPTPTATVRGGTLLGAAVANTTDSTTAPTTLNALLAALRSAGVIAAS